MGRSSPILAVAVLVATAVLACTPPKPTAAPNAVVYFRNLSGSALMAGVGSGDTQSLAVLRPCGGEATLAVWPPPANYPFVFMSAAHDATGAFDALVAEQPAGPIDPDTLDYGQFTGIIWSRGNVAYADLPIWITFRAGTTDDNRAAPTDTAPPHCDPWPNSE